MGYIIKSLIRPGLFLILILSNNYSGYAVDVTDAYIHSKPGETTLNKQRWEKLKEDYKYRSPKLDTSKNQNSTFRKPSLSFDSGLLRVLSYLVIFLLITWIIYILVRYSIGRDKRLQKINLDYNVTDEPTDISTLNIDLLLVEALKNGDYRLAIRLRFLALLQLLNQKKYIEWKRERTNQQYAQQLTGNNFQVDFRKICQIYELAWYGDYKIDETRYHSCDSVFNHTLLLISDNKHV